MYALLVALLLIAVVGGLVVGFVAYPYRGRPVPRARALTDKVAAVAEQLDPGESPPLGVLSTPEKSRRMSRRFEQAEHLLKHPAQVLTGSSSQPSADH